MLEQAPERGGLEFGSGLVVERHGYRSFPWRRRAWDLAPITIVTHRRAFQRALQRITAQLMPVAPCVPLFSTMKTHQLRRGSCEMSLKLPAAREA